MHPQRLISLQSRPLEGNTPQVIFSPSTPNSTKRLVRLLELDGTASRGCHDFCTPNDCHLCLPLRGNLAPTPTFLLVALSLFCFDTMNLVFSFVVGRSSEFGVKVEEVGVGVQLGEWRGAWRGDCANI